MTDEKLIEEAAKAIWEESTDFGRKSRWEDEPDWTFDEYANMARAAFAVFEKAHAPTDDDRMAIADEISGIAVGEGYYSQTIGINAALEAADAVLAAGFRRPIHEETTPSVRGHVRALTGATDAELDELGGFTGEPTEAEAWAAAQAFARAIKEQTGAPSMVNVEHARAALRAAAETRGEER